jgi:hypothetical protein
MPPGAIEHNDPLPTQRGGSRVIGMLCYAYLMGGKESKAVGPNARDGKELDFVLIDGCLTRW